MAKIRMLDSMDGSGGLPGGLGGGGNPADSMDHGETAVRNAVYAKADATDKWVRGDISGKKHTETHRRADAVIKSGGILSGVHSLGGGREKVKTSGDGHNLKAKGAKNTSTEHGLRSNTKGKAKGDSGADVTRGRR